MMDYLTERDHVIRRLEHHLKRLVEYRQTERTADCAVVFSTAKPRVAAEIEDRIATRRRSRSVAGAAAVGGRPDDTAALASRPRQVEERFVQFAFLRHTFYLDLPRTTLHPIEADHLLKRRSGFFRLRDRRWAFQSFEEWSDVVREWNPVEKEYLNVDVRSAAEELAYLFYTLWRYPLDTRLYWQAFCFRRRKARPWEGCGRV